MPAIDFLLNLSGLILWLSWRSIRFDPLLKSTPVTLVGTLRRAEPRRVRGGPLALVLLTLIVLRAVLYWLIGAPAEWTPKLNLELVVLAFRGDIFSSVLVYSLLSFIRTLVVFYFWLLIVAMINRGAKETGSIQKLIRQHLGKLANWPWPIQLTVPFLIVIILWMALHPVLTRIGVVLPVYSVTHLAEQGLLVGLGLLLSLKYVLTAFLLLHLVASYVYLGTSPFWDFIASTSTNITAPLRALPLRLARLDLAPAVGVILILSVLEWLPNMVLSKLSASNLSAWPL
jgi:uncharacterized protein YggT (Ycf19 family)